MCATPLRTQLLGCAGAAVAPPTPVRAAAPRSEAMPTPRTTRRSMGVPSRAALGGHCVPVGRRGILYALLALFRYPFEGVGLPPALEVDQPVLAGEDHAFAEGPRADPQLLDAE